MSTISVATKGQREGSPWGNITLWDSKSVTWLPDKSNGLSTNLFPPPVVDSRKPLLGFQVPLRLMLEGRLNGKDDSRKLLEDNVDPRSGIQTPSRTWGDPESQKSWPLECPHRCEHGLGGPEECPPGASHPVIPTRPTVGLCWKGLPKRTRTKQQPHA